MDANRSFLKPTKWLIATGVIAFAIPLLVLFATLRSQPLMAGECAAPFTFVEYFRNGEKTVANGEYALYTGTGKPNRTTYTGAIIYYDAQGEKKRIVRVNREIAWDVSFRHDQIISKITHNGRRMGDNSSDAEVMQYIFPNYHPDETIHATLFQLGGSVLATGPHNVPRILCEEK